MFIILKSSVQRWWSCSQCPSWLQIGSVFPIWKIPKFVDKTQTKFPEFKLEIFWKKFQEDIVEREDKQHVSGGKKFDVSLKNTGCIWLVCKQLFLCGSLAGLTNVCGYLEETGNLFVGPSLENNFKVWAEYQPGLWLLFLIFIKTRSKALHIFLITLLPECNAITPAKLFSNSENIHSEHWKF